MGGKSKGMERVVNRQAVDLIADVRNCRRCRVPPESYPIVSEYCGQRFFLLGQAPGKEELRQNRKFAGPAGRTLFRWFAQAGMGDESAIRRHLFICAVAHCWPGTREGSSDDLPPSAEMRGNCSGHVAALLELVDPDWVLAVGGYAQQAIFGAKRPLRELVGVVHQVVWGVRERNVLVLPHPSGLSRWLNDPVHRALHERGLGYLREAWQQGPR